MTNRTTADLDHHDGRVEAGAFFDPHHQNGGDHQSDDEGRHIHSDFHAKQVRRMQQIMRAFATTPEIAAP